ncbi:MAG: ABC transporter ATP-binding protein [bacterium]
MAIIQFRDVWEMYRIKFIIDGKVSWENFWALKGISFEMEKGETLGIIGENGAGKSTILKLIARMLKPDRGEIKVLGRVSGLLELGAGFQPELTGRENIYLNAGLFGLTQSQIDERYEEIVNFANIGKFIDAPVKCYSQGMFVRLAFAIAIHANPDILLIDDTLAVGDEHFQRKCIKKIFELKEQGKTIIFVTHDMNMLSRLCKRAIFLKEGRIVKDDSIDKVIPLYSQMIGTREGVGILEKEPLNIVFNNGRLFINWQDKLLTPNSGAYTTFLISDKWYSSLQADWEVKRENENKLIAISKFYQLALTQIWQLELVDNYEIKWDIELDSEESFEIREGFINVMLTNEYTQWFTTLENGKFSLIDDYAKNWQTFLDGNIFRKCIGVEAKEISVGKLPSLIFEQFNCNTKVYAQILNTDYLTNCRVLQYKTLGLQNYSVTQANHFVYFSGKILLNISDIDRYLKNFDLCD